MGKKHKKESKKRKHHSKSRSRSRSLDRELEKEKKRHHKRHHKKKEKCVKRFKSDVSSVSDDDVEFIPNTPAPPKISKGGSPSPPPPPKISIPSPPPSSNAAPKKEGDSLSIADTNILRAKLGLKPLQISEEKPVPVSNGSVVIEGGVDMGEFVHKPAEDLTSKKNTEKIRAKLAERREKRDIERKIKSVKGLGEDDSDSTIDDTLTWVSRNRKIENDRMLAMKKAKELDEMDEEFGIGELVQEELKKEKSKVYTSTDLKGLTVEHDINQFHEGRAVILTLKDKGVLDEDVDRLINVNLIDDERHKKNVLNRKKKPFGFSGLDIDEMGDEDDEKKVLSKYDEEIDGEKKSSFKLGPDAILRNKEAVKQKLQAKAKMTLESLQLPELKVASDYYSEAEMQAKFKKPKKTRKVRKKTLKADDLAGSSVTGPRNQDFGSRNGKLIKEEVVSVIGDEHQSQITSDSEQMDIDSDIFENIKIENPEEDMELELALKKARRLKHLELKPELSFPPDIVKNEVEPSVGSNTWIPSSSTSEFEDSGVGSNIVMNSTAEFCRTLGDIPTYGLSGNRDEEAPDLLDFEKELKEQNKKQEENNDRGGWNDAEMDDKLVDIRQVEAPILDAEPNLGAGVAGALRLAMSKGYLEKETSNRPSAARFAHLQAQNYSIEDKAHANQLESREDEKFGRRERYMGPTSEFKEKEMYKPNIKLEYIDDEGHLLSAKEAFRYLSHKFHGKGPGKNKVEKRMKKGEQQVLMKQMSSTDTPLGTLQMLQQKQKETQSAFVVLSGSKQLSGPTSISKAKLTK